MSYSTLQSISRSSAFILILLSFIFAQVATEQLYHGAYDMALAGSNVAHQVDAWAALENPAGLARVTGINATLGYNRLYNQSYLPHTMLAAALAVGKFGVAGLALDRIAVSYQDNDLTSETALSLTQGFYLQKDRNSTLAFGYALKFLQVDYGQSAGITGDGSDGIKLGTSSTVGLDIGITASLRERHRLGVRVLNVNRPSLDNGNFQADLPRAIQLGLSYSPYNLVWTNFALIRSANYPTQYAAGIEYQILPALTLVSGVQSNPNRLGSGLRINLAMLTIDYGLLTHPVLPVSHQFALGVAF